MVTLAATMAQMAIGVLCFCVRDPFKCCATATPEPSDDDDEVDGATVENEAIVRPKSHTSLPLETLV